MGVIIIYTGTYDHQWRF